MYKIMEISCRYSAAGAFRIIFRRYFMRKRTKRALAGILSLAALSSLAACSDDGSGTTETTTTTEKTEWTGDKVDVNVGEDDFDTSIDIRGKTLKWMGFYDLNPSNEEPDRKTEIAIFEDVYGAKVEWMRTEWSTQFDDLANAINAGNPPDIFVHGQQQFPYDINMGRFQAIDSIVDWEDPMWAEMKETADKLMWKGEHYVAPFGYRFDDYQILMYDATVIEDMGLDDPLELYEEDKWDWDAFKNTMLEFQGGEENKYGIAGWWTNAFIYTSGDPMVKYEDGKFINNLASPNIERAQSYLGEFKANGLIGPWRDVPQAFVSGDILFYGMGTWSYNAVVDSAGGHEIKIVPFPKAPGSDTYYMNKAIFAHMWVKGSDNADVLKVWYDINRMINYDETYLQTKKEKYLSNYTNWTEENYDMVAAYSDDTKFPLAYDYGYGLNKNMNDDIMNTLYSGLGDSKWESWPTAREEYSTIVDAAISDYQ